MKKQISYKIVSLVFSILVLCFAIAFYAVGWDEPGMSPPSGNVDAPLNTGNIAQDKSGPLRIGGVFRTDSETVLAVLGGNVGIGTTSPGQMLELYRDNADSVIRFHDPGDAWFSMGIDRDTLKFHINQGSGVGTSTGLIIDQSNNVGIGTTSPSQKLDVAGYIKGQTGLCIGSDCRTTWPAAGADTRCDTSGTCGQVCIGSNCRATWPTGGTGDITGVTAGTGLTGGGTSGDVTLNADTTYVQRRVSSSCSAGSSIRAISSTGTVTCEPDDTGGGSLGCVSRSGTFSVSGSLTCPSGYAATAASCRGYPTLKDSGNSRITSNGVICYSGIGSSSTMAVRCCRVQ